jgi:hypothetical protein
LKNKKLKVFGSLIRVKIEDFSFFLIWFLIEIGQKFDNGCGSVVKKTKKVEKKLKKS